MLKIDIHSHMLPASLPDLESRYGYGGWISLEHHQPDRARMMRDGSFFREIRSNCFDPTVRITDLDAADVDYQVLSTVPVIYSYWARPEHTLDLSRLINDHLAEVCRTYPTRFGGLGTLPMQDPELAAGELVRCMEELDLHGVGIGSHVNDWNLDDPALYPVYETAESLGACILVHPWDMMGSERMEKYWLPWLVGMPAESSLAICSMIFGGIFERFPDLRVCFCHGGGSFPFTLGRIEHGFKVRPDLCAVENKTSPRDYLGRFWLDSAVHDEAALRYMLDLVGADAICLGSDAPFPLGEQVPGRMIEEMDGIEEETRSTLLSGAACRFLGLDPEDLSIASHEEIRA